MKIQGKKGRGREKSSWWVLKVSKKKTQQRTAVQKKKIIDKLCGSNIKTDLKKDEGAILTINFFSTKLERNWSY